MEIYKKILRELRKDCRDEAKLILTQAKMHAPNEYADIIKYANAENYNIVCLALDTAKIKLVELKIIEQKETDNFGKNIFI